jgi:PAS domain S-box-containing protein
MAAGLCLVGFGVAALGIGSISGPAAIAFAGLVAGSSLTATGFWLLRRRQTTIADGASDADSAVTGESINDRSERLEELRLQLGDSSVRLRELLDAQDDIIVRRDQSGRILFANRAFCQMFGFEADCVVGVRFEPKSAEGNDAVAPSDAEAPGEDYRQLVETMIGARWIAWHSHRLPHPDGVGYDVQSVGRDVTEQQASVNELAIARDEAEAANRAKSRFLASMSHEIRTPMNGILGMAGLLIETGPSAEQKTYIEAIDQSARTLLSLIDEILDFSRIEAGRLQIKAEPFDLEACVQSVVELLAPRAHGKDLEIAWTVPPHLPRSLIGDEVRLRQVLINLVGNAIKFTERGGVRVTVELCGTEPALHRLRIKVIDTGVGLSTDEISTIFAEFAQGSEAPHLSVGGSGLGLAISRKLARAMGGDITVDSVRGQGATFTLDLALATDPENLTVVRPIRFPKDFSVLLVSEQLIERRAMADLLRASGSHVSEISDVGDSDEIARVAEAVGRVDAMVVDVQSDPLVAGHALQRLAAQLGSKDIMGVVLADAAARTNLRAMEAVGFRRFLVRPVRPETLFRLLLGDRRHGGKTGSITAGAERMRGAGAYDGMRVLLAEDNDITALLSVTLLRKLGCSSHRVHDGADAIAAVRDTVEGDEPHYDLILMDLSMPRVDGIAAMHAIRSLCEDSAVACPTIVAITANAYSEDRKHALAQGMDGFVVKPFEREELTALLDRCASTKALVDDIDVMAP